MFGNILVVCVGNICRSPALERLLLHKGVEATVSSAGLGALVNKPIERQMAAQLESLGVNTGNHQARQLSVNMLQTADLVLVMELGHLRSIREMAPQQAGKVMLAGHWLEKDEVADPYRQSDEVFEACCQHLDECAASWVSKL